MGHLRIIDKFSIFPPTTYVGKEFPRVVQERKDLIEYRQANLTVPGQSRIPIILRYVASSLSFHFHESLLTSAPLSLPIRHAPPSISSNSSPSSVPFIITRTLTSSFLASDHSPPLMALLHNELRMARTATTTGSPHLNSRNIGGPSKSKRILSRATPHVCPPLDYCGPMRVETVARCFTDPAPNGRPYSHVFDLSGDQTFERPSEVQISQTLKVSLGIAKEAAKHDNVKSYVRSMHPFYDQVTETKSYKEDNAEGWKPLGLRGLWWHETLRAVANVPNLPLVVLRHSYLYGATEPRGEGM